MMDTEILLNDVPAKIGDVIEQRLSRNYKIYSFIQDFSKYGVPQSRIRSITIGKFTPNNESGISYFPPTWFDTGSVSEVITLRQALYQTHKNLKDGPLSPSSTP